MTQATKTPTASSFMNTQAKTIAPDLPLREIVQYLREHELSNVPVVDTQAGGQPLFLGFITEADCLHYLANEIFYGSPAPRYIAEMIMQRHPICVGPDVDLFELVSIFESHRLRHLPVLDGEKHLLGIVSRRDILHALHDYYENFLQKAESERHPIDLRKLLNLRFFWQT
ncbi:MAG: CBS domain-containing protein [Planctomycetaceae bacterium]|nr:CBS domain-containing protein [Planctomycetaceae bacterium]